MTTPLIHKRLSRRQVLASAAGLGVLGTGLLAACAAPAPAPAPTTAPAPAAAPTTAPAVIPSPTAPPKPAAPTATTAAAAPTTAPAAPTAAPAAATPTAAPKPAAAQPQQGGSLKAVLSSEPTTLHPLIARTTFDRTAYTPVLDMLFEYDEKYNPVPTSVVKSVDILPDLKTYVFHVREGVEWHDGKPLTGQDIKDTFDLLMAPEVPGVYVLKRQVKDGKVDLVDNMTVKLELPAPNGTLLDSFTALAVIRKDFDEKKPIGTGPFKFVEWARNQHLKFKRNEKFYKKGMPYLDELTLLPTPDETQAVNLLINGQVDTIDKVALQRIKDVDSSGKAKVIFLPSDYNIPFYLFMMNNAQPNFEKVEVRQAINWAIDRQALLEATFNYGSVRSNQVPKSHWAHNPNAPSYDKRDVAKAKQLMAQAGLANGFTTTLTYHLLANEFAQFAQIIQANLAEINIKVNLKLLEVGLWVDEVLRSKTFQMAMTWNVPGWDPDSLLGGWTRSDGASQSWKRTDEYEALLRQGAAVVDIEQRKPFYFKAQDLVFTEVPGAIINEKATMVAAVTKVQGFQAQIRGNTAYDKVWIQK